MIGCDDLDALGWDRIFELLQRDGAFGFRLVAAERRAEMESRLYERGFRLDEWDVYLADAETARAACAGILAAGTPSGFADLPRPSPADHRYIASLQSVMAAAGIVPFSGSMLVGVFGPALVIAVGDEAGAPAAVGHGYLPHNRFSAYRGYAWGGLVAVDEQHRGKGLGAYVNARIISGALDDLGATHVYELISSANVASQRMALACGLRPAQHLLCGIASPVEAGKFTR